MSMRSPPDCFSRSAQASRHGSARFPAPLAKPSLPAFTLVEMLVVIAIIAVLAAMIVPAVSRMQQSAWEAACLSNIRQLLVATQSAANDRDGRFPAMCYVEWYDTAVYNSSLKFPKVLSPYIGTNPTNSSSVQALLRCPAASRNKNQWIWNDWYWPHYRYNEWFATNTLPQFKYSDAVLFFDADWSDWQPSVCAHFPGPRAILNIGYADGHVASMAQTNFQQVAAGSETSAVLFKKGWVTNQ